jgi:hypothetical protein
MKRKLIPVILAVLVIGLITTNTSCVKVNFDEDGDGGGGGGTVDSTIQGRIDNSISFPKGKYTLKGFVYVGSGATLTFAPGSVILASTDVKTALIIEVGGKLIADGTPTEPIVFTSSKPAGQRTNGDWGGISICGAAPTNRPISPAPITEGGSNRPYGGTNANDNSGVLRYVRIEFAGITAENNSELNGLTLYAVGAGTVIDYVQTAYCGDDGFEFFGGNVNAKHLFSFAAGDDDFDFDFGYSGRIQYAVCLRDKFADDDRTNGIECDNDGTGTTASPITKPILSNFTLIGLYDTTGTAAISNQYGHGNRWRRSTRFILRNSIILGYKRSAVFLEDNNTINDWIAGQSEFKNNLVHSYNSTVYETSNQSLLTNADFKTALETTHGNTTLANRDAAMLTAPFSLSNPDFRPATGSPALAGASYSGLDAFFTTGTYRGAFGADNWLSGWANYDPQNKVY